MPVKRLLLGFTFCVFASTVYLSPAYSGPLTILGTANFLDFYGVNPIGVGKQIGTSAYYAGFTSDSISASVIPSGPPTGTGTMTLSSDGTTVTATQGTHTVSLRYLNSFAFPNMFFRNVPVSPTGSWQITAYNSGTSATDYTPTLTASTTPPPDTAIQISGSTLAPTISWTVPTTPVPTGSTLTQTVFLFKKALQGSGAYWTSKVLSSTANSVQVPTGVLSSGQAYSVSIQTDLRNSTTGVLEARTRQFTGYVAASNTPIPTPVLLPDVSPNAGPAGQPVYQFNSAVSQGEPILLDPLVATGFIYQIGAGDPNFASVLLPDIGNSVPYQVCVDGATQFSSCTSLGANTWLDFVTGGVSEFEVLGIDPSLALDPNNATDFVTSVKFTADGNFTGTMTPLTTEVPEPPTWAIMLFGLVGMGFVSNRHRKRKTATAIAV